MLTPSEIEEINKTKLTVLFRKGETIRKQGTYMSHVLSVNIGYAKLYLEGLYQNDAILRIVKPTNFIGGPGIYLDRLHHFTVTALVDTRVCFIDVALFKDIIDNNRAFAHEFLKDLSRNTLNVQNRLLNLTQKQMHGRMADSLIYLADEIFGALKIPAFITRQDLAELSAMSKESAQKILREFHNEKFIHQSDQEITLVNMDALKMLSKKG